MPALEQKPDARLAVEDPAEFSRFIDHALSTLKLPERALCEQFDVSVYIVEGWRRGESAPTRTFRTNVVAYLERLLESSNGSAVGRFRDRLRRLTGAR
jgi:hypothetical protein